MLCVLQKNVHYFEASAITSSDSQCKIRHKDPYIKVCIKAYGENIYNSNDMIIYKNAIMHWYVIRIATIVNHGW